MNVAGWKTPMLSRYRHKDSYRSAKAIQFGGHKEDTTGGYLRVWGKYAIRPYKQKNPRNQLVFANSGDF